ncbi:phage baseplate assembly protein V [Sphingosinicella terrae]|uniref:phage baseplate assembly protein V n=1 Tax=Sphingosinicella terrae TaxID=2172047 RepID=UPI00254955A9|nr:phage baseplate assembly protein V [Sphingosinicella terrae]
MMEELDRVVQGMSQRYYGKYRGTVVDTADSTKRGRLKVRVPSVMGDKEMWAMPCAPYAGASVGFFALPPAESSIWVEFEGGEISQPIWSGCFWKDGEIDSADAVEGIAFWKTPGLTLRVDNDAGTVEIETSGGSKITIKSDSIKIEAPEVELSANGGSAKVSASGFDAMNGALTAM